MAATGRQRKHFRRTCVAGPGGYSGSPLTSPGRDANNPLPDQFADSVCETGQLMTFDYGAFSFESKEDLLERSREFWNPGKTDFWVESGVPLVIDRREEYFIYDMSGKRLIDVHLNGGTYNLGHRNAEVVTAVTQAMAHFDIGNHHFPSLARTALAEALVRTAPPGLTKVVYGSGGGEAIDIAIKTARHSTQKRKVVSIVKAYHGHTGLAVGTGDDRFSKLFLADRPEEFPHVPFNDLAAMEEALHGRDVAAVIMETIPATYGFPLPDAGYLERVKALCERYDALYIAEATAAATSGLRCPRL